MANEKNLIPFTSNQSREEAEKNGRKGGQKSGEVRRQRKAMKDMMKALLSLELPDCEGKERLKEYGIENEDLNIQTAILMQQIQKAMNGNLDSAKFVRDVSESEDKQTKNEESQSLAEAIQKAYEGKVGDK